MLSLAYVQLMVGDKEKKNQWVDAHGPTFRKTVFAPITIVQLAIIIWLSPISICYASGADKATLFIQSKKMSTNYSDLQACRSASFLQLFLCFYLVKHLKSRESILLLACQKYSPGKSVSVFQLQRRFLDGCSSLRLAQAGCRCLCEQGAILPNIFISKCQKFLFSYKI